MVLSIHKIHLVGPTLNPEIRKTALWKSLSCSRLYFRGQHLLLGWVSVKMNLRGVVTWKKWCLCCLSVLWPSAWLGHWPLNHCSPRKRPGGKKYTWSWDTDCWIHLKLWKSVSQPLIIKKSSLHTSQFSHSVLSDSLWPHGVSSFNYWFYSSSLSSCWALEIQQWLRDCPNCETFLASIRITWCSSKC